MKCCARDYHCSSGKIAIYSKPSFVYLNEISYFGVWIAAGIGVFYSDNAKGVPPVLSLQVSRLPVLFEVCLVEATANAQGSSCHLCGHYSPNLLTCSVRPVQSWLLLLSIESTTSRLMAYCSQTSGWSGVVSCLLRLPAHNSLNSTRDYVMCMRNQTKMHDSAVLHVN